MRVGLGAVVERRRGAVRVHVDDVVRRQTRRPRARARSPGPRRGRSARGAVRWWASEVARSRAGSRGCARRARAAASSSSSTSTPGALAHHEAVAAAVEGARDAASASASMRAKAAVASGVIAASLPPVTTRVGVAVADQPHRHADRVRARRAGRHGAERLAAQVVLHGHHARGGVGHQQRDRQRRDRSRALLAQDDVLVLERADAADARADHAGDAVGVAGRAVLPAGVLERLARRRARAA